MNTALSSFQPGFIRFPVSENTGLFSTNGSEKLQQHLKTSWRVSCDAGAWEARNEKFGTSTYQAILSGDVVIALVVSHTDSLHQGAPDTDCVSQVIAAAPEMIGALRKAVVALAICLNGNPDPVLWKAYEDACAALKKAEG